ncbi:cupin domain-containing protein [Moraxella bovis]|uniref:cupin domain-containing protein n=1 Tax=Moraxella bovis TaxID=476 RepID=UPI002225CCB8|nr:cupin domain-containing protein [Moraxella bovis]UYZ67447.1 cupin domain-containing protein [Moraxella bovis]UYZ69807.1 cupin domain-containing protein [Moraxella bovis]UYZ74272.1 cupin domain-containing protein [Moraxella bovis]UYZ93921.1 cupin domain-containing protein [Moraxella bovis]UZA13091.1 cupin domain-containing protein [Moraxella bovis]
MTDTPPFCLPADITPEIFLAEYWQKKPLLIKNGLPALVGMFEPTDVLDLAIEDGVSARLIAQKDDNPKEWTLKNSPLTEQDLQNTPRLWTVLVQNLEQWSPELGELWQAFDFIPKWQQDDIMVSVAGAGGSVGEHYDEYDVFLAQGYGSRRWTLGKMCSSDTPFIEGQPIRLLDDMGQIIFDEILEAGDVLYVPPRLSHYGVAQDDCLTFSFGFRRPNMVQILDEVVDVATGEHALFSPLILPQALQNNAYELTDESISTIKNELINLLNSDKGNAILTQGLSELVSKRQYDLIAFDDELAPDELAERLQNGECLMINPACRFVRQNDDWYINGECVCFNDKELALINRFTNHDVITFDDLSCDLDNDLLASCANWLNDNWLILI